MPGTAWPRPAGDIIRTRLPRPGQRGAGEEPRRIAQSRPRERGDPYAEELQVENGAASWITKSAGGYGSPFSRGRREVAILHYLFLFAGLRFSMNAAMPSERSSSAKVE